jgi:hypothetical protein
MTDTSSILSRLRGDEPTLRRQYAIHSLALFGSAARGEAGPASDIDLLVEFDRPVGLMHVSRTARHLEELLGAPVDLVLRRAVLTELRDDILGGAVDAF